MIFQQLVRRSEPTVKILKIGTPKIITIIVLKMEQFVFFSAVIDSKDSYGMPNSVDPD